MNNVNMIVACDLNGGMGYKNKLPWEKNKEDMKWFRNNTNGHVVVMGKNTWNSIGAKPLPNRINYVVTTSYTELDLDESVGILNPLHQHLPMHIKDLSHKYPYLKIWIMGGAQLYNDLYPYCDAIYLTRIEREHKCDAYLYLGMFNYFQNCIYRERLNDYTEAKILKKGRL